MQYYKVQRRITTNAWTIKSANQLHLQVEQHIQVFLQKQDKSIEAIRIKKPGKTKLNMYDAILFKVPFVAIKQSNL